jgi:protein-tyrosine phosphatase
MARKIAIAEAEVAAFSPGRRDVSGFDFASRELPMKTLLFVCSGNSDRSPAAEYLARQHIEDDNLGIEVGSRGTNVRSRAGPGWQLMAALPAARAHVPTPLDRDAIEWADLILTMNRQHKAIVTELVPGAADRTYCLYEYADGSARAVTDPIDLGQEDYEEFLDELKRLVARSLDRLARA